MSDETPDWCKRIGRELDNLVSDGRKAPLLRFDLREAMTRLQRRIENETCDCPPNPTFLEKDFDCLHCSDVAFLKRMETTDET